MKCPKCNSDTGEEDNFCPQCGNDLKKARREGDKGKQPDSGFGNLSEGAAPEKTSHPCAGGESENEKEKSAPEAQETVGGEGDFSASQAPKASGPEAASAAPPEGKISGGLLAAAIIAGVLALAGVGCGIVQTVITSNFNASSSQSDGSDLASGNSSSSSSGAGNASGSSSSSSPSSSSSGPQQTNSTQGATDAVSDLENSQSCSNEGGSANLQGSPTSQSAFSVSGTSDWGPVLSCVAEATQMPASDQAQIKSFVNQISEDGDDGSSPSSSAPQTVSWSLGDKSKIYATFAPSPGGQGGWSVNFASTEAESAADFQDSESEGESSGSSLEGTAAASALQNAVQQCPANGQGADLESNPSGPDMLIASGQTDWGPVLSCVAEETQMPASDQAQIKSFVNGVSANSNSDLSGGSLNWSMKDGSKIYASYAPSASQPGAWILDMGDASSSTGN